MKIGDLWLYVKANMKGFDQDVTAQATKTGEKAGSNLSKGMQKHLSGAKGGILQGLGLGAGLGAFSLASTAISQLTDVVGESIKAFNADQESQNRLKASLKANIPAWNENTDAIEENILAKQRLGFDDETLRDSLTVLVGATHDVTKAQNIMNTAMDLARFKGIDLKTASEALIKVEGGVYRSLKQLGIKLKDNATSTEALAAVQAVANGQAEAYAETNNGKLLISQIKVGEAMERLGEILAGPVADATVAAADAIEGVVEAVQDLDESLAPIGGLGEVLYGVSVALRSVTVGGNSAIIMMQDQENAARKLVEEHNRLRDSIEDTVIASRSALVPAIEKVSASWDEEAAAAEDAKRRTIYATQKLTSYMLQAARDLIAGYYDPIEKKQELRAVNAELADLREIASKKKLTREQKERQTELERSQAELLLDLGEAGAASGKTYEAAMKDLLKRLKTAHGKEKEMIEAEIAALKRLKSQAVTTAATLTKQGFTRGGSSKGRTIEFRAQGGGVKAGQPYVVNENTPRSEIFVPNVSGDIYPNMAEVPRQTQASSGNTYNIAPVIQGLPPARDPFAVARQLRRISEMGQLDRKDDAA